jgi:hypothetical protein
MITNAYFCFVIQDLYPEHQVDVEVPNEDNNGWKEHVGDHAGGVGAPLVEAFAVNPIGSSAAETPRPSAADQTIATAPSRSGQEKKHVALGTKRKQDKPLADQVIIELPPYRGPRSPPDLVTVEHIFGCLFEAF